MLSLRFTAICLLYGDAHLPSPQHRDPAPAHKSMEVCLALRPSFCAISRKTRRRSACSFSISAKAYRSKALQTRFLRRPSIASGSWNGRAKTLHMVEAAYDRQTSNDDGCLTPIAR
jgi:hypothetical protein